MIEAHIRIGWKAIFRLAAAAVFAVGLVVIVQKVDGWIHSDRSGRGKTAAASQVMAAGNSNFAYLLPGKVEDWTFDPKSTLFDQQHGIVKYAVAYKGGSVDATITQQQMPDQLKPRGSDKFKAFIKGSKPTHTQDVAGGTVYYLPALVNGTQTATGSDTIIYARDDILMFGKAGAILNFESWTKLLASMRKTDPKQH